MIGEALGKIQSKAIVAHYLYPIKGNVSLWRNFVHASANLDLFLDGLCPVLKQIRNEL